MLVSIDWVVSGDDSSFVETIGVNGWWVVDVFWSIFLVELSLIEEQSESRVVTGGQVFDEDIFEISEVHRAIGVSIVGNHEVKSISWVRDGVFVHRSVEIGDHLGGFLGVHVSRSVVVVLSEDHSSQFSSGELIESSFVGGLSESGFSGGGDLDSLSWGEVRRSGNGGWSLDSGGNWSLNSGGGVLLLLDWLSGDDWGWGSSVGLSLDDGAAGDWSLGLGVGSDWLRLTHLFLFLSDFLDFYTAIEFKFTPIAY